MLRAADRLSGIAEEPYGQQPRTLYGSPEEKLAQMQAYHKLKGAVKTESIECHKRSLCFTARAFGYGSTHAHLNTLFR